MPGIDKNRVIGMCEQDLDEFTCDICHELFSEPVVTQCCRQTYCSDCITQWLSHNNSCPNDRQPLSVNKLSSAPRLVVNLLSNMRVNCDYELNGCQTVVAMNELSNHSRNCKYNPNNKCKTCGLNIESDFKHNCIEILLTKNESLMNENIRLKKENSELKQEIRKLELNTNSGTQSNNEPNADSNGHLTSGEWRQHIGLSAQSLPQSIETIPLTTPRGPMVPEHSVRPKTRSRNSSQTSVFSTDEEYDWFSRIDSHSRSRSADNNIYVKNLTDEYNSDYKLRELFSPFGQIISVKVARDERGLFKGYGFVSFIRPEMAKTACDVLNGKLMANGKQLYVGIAQKKAERQAELQRKFEQLKLDRSNCDIKLIVHNLDDQINDQWLLQLFRPFGQIIYTKVMNNSLGQKFGFVSYPTIDEAKRAMATMNGSLVFNKRLFIQLHENKDENQLQFTT